jgi:hypothetical protein
MRRHVLIGLLSVVVAIGVVGGWAIAAHAEGRQDGAGNEMVGMDKAADAHAGHSSHNQVSPTPTTQAVKLAEVSAAIDAAKKAIASGDSKTALAELDKAKALLASATAPASVATTGTAPAKAVVKVVNTKCPIMGGAVDPNKLSDALIRDFNGQKIGFCCGGCPGQWDKLSDADRQAKFTAVMDTK